MSNEDLSSPTLKIFHKISELNSQSSHSNLETETRRSEFSANETGISEQILLSIRTY